MYRISKRFSFSAAHSLPHLPPEHPCARLHGHNYVVELTIVGEPDDRGFVFDYRDMDPFKRWLDANVDHQNLNQVVAAPPTAEYLALLFFNRARMLGIPVTSVGVSETDKTWAVYTEDPR